MNTRKEGRGNCEHNSCAVDGVVQLSNNDDSHYVTEFDSWAEIEVFISELCMEAEKAFGERGEK